jgi:hypothetical protein
MDLSLSYNWRMFTLFTGINNISDEKYFTGAPMVTRARYFTRR